MTARGTDWTLAALVSLLVGTGLASWLWADAWLVDLHDVAGLGLVGVVAVKTRRVWRRLLRGSWDRATRVGALALLVVGATLLSGVVWSSTAKTAIWGYTTLVWHTGLGFVLAAAVLVHLVLRAKRLRRRDLTDRRQALVLGGTALASVVAWRAQDPLTRALGLPAGRRRGSGSYPVASFSGNAFPATSWVADAPRELDPVAWRLVVGGHVARPGEVPLARLAAADDRLTAELDCTGGFATTQAWRGARLDRVLAAAGPTPSASHVRVASVTGYRWSFHLDDASQLLLATHVGDEPLAHGHGAPVRLVAPGRRGWQWIKWVTHVELLDGPDLGAPASTLWSSFTDTGRGAS